MKFSKFYLLFFLLIFVFSFSACTKKKDDDEALIINNGELTQEESYFSSTVADLFKQKKPLQCAVSIEDEEAIVNMTYYFDNNGEKFRVETNSVNKSDASKVNSFGIFKDDWYYFWDDLMNKDGMKTKIEGEADEEYNIDMNEEFEFKCKSWTIDNSFFELPKDKPFKDLTEMFNNFDSVDSLEYNLDACSYCEILPAGPDRDECLNDC